MDLILPKGAKAERMSSSVVSKGILPTYNLHYSPLIRMGKKRERERDKENKKERKKEEK